MNTGPDYDRDRKGADPDPRHREVQGSGSAPAHHGARIAESVVHYEDCSRYNWHDPDAQCDGARCGPQSADSVRAEKALDELHEETIGIVRGAIDAWKMNYDPAGDGGPEPTLPEFIVAELRKAGRLKGLPA